MSSATLLRLAPNGWAPPAAPQAAEAALPARPGELPLAPPPPLDSAEDFARSVIRAICAAGVSEGAARLLYERCCRTLALGGSVRAGFRHPGKAEAVEAIWRERARLYQGFLAANDRGTYLETLPWIGPATRRRLARELGLIDLESSSDSCRAAA
jgi:hypothetical protein